MFSPGLPFDSSDQSESWIHRVRENLRMALHVVKVCPVAMGGAPLHFESVDMSTKRGAPQTVSAGVHLAIIAALVFLAVSPPKHIPRIPIVNLNPGPGITEYIPPLSPQGIGQASLGTQGGGGESDPRPTRFGQLAPGSSMPLVPPRMNRNQENVLPVPPAVFDPNAPASVPTVILGLPWMNGDTDSAGPGKGHGFGSGDGDTMGDGHGGNGSGDGEGSGPYANVASPVTCLYCPEPLYSEEARKAKLQGKVLMQVLVGPDGAAKRVKIIQGLGMGLDERAQEAVMAWRFSPGRDAAKRPVATWVTIETRFQLF